MGDAAHPMLPRASHLMTRVPLRLLTAIIDHGQGAAQGFEDAIALGLLLAGVDKSHITERLAGYLETRLNRAYAMLKLSNMAFDDQEAPKGLHEFLEGHPRPSKHCPAKHSKTPANSQRAPRDHVRDDTFRVWPRRS
jgi:salicylate hydroxylase